MEDDRENVEMSSGQEEISDDHRIDNLPNAESDQSSQAQKESPEGANMTDRDHTTEAKLTEKPPEDNDANRKLEPPEKDNINCSSEVIAPLSGATEDELLNGDGTTQDVPHKELPEDANMTHEDHDNKTKLTKKPTENSDGNWKELSQNKGSNYSTEVAVATGEVVTGDGTTQLSLGDIPANEDNNPSLAASENTSNEQKQARPSEIQTKTPENRNTAFTAEDNGRVDSEDNDAGKDGNGLEDLAGIQKQTTEKEVSLAEVNTAQSVEAERERAAGDCTTHESSGDVQSHFPASGNTSDEQEPARPSDNQTETSENRNTARIAENSDRGDSEDNVADNDDNGQEDPAGIQKLTTEKEDTPQVDSYKEATGKVKERLAPVAQNKAADSVLNSLHFYTREEELNEYFCVTCNEG